MLVADASVVVEILLQSQAAPRMQARLFDAGEVVCAPHLIDLECAQALRRYTRAEAMSTSRASAALTMLLELPLVRFEHTPLLERVWQLRHALTAYDAAYVALAEALDAPLVTRDRAFAHVPTRARIEVF
jgi:predicted nucleic acid-binding protein